MARINPAWGQVGLPCRFDPAPKKNQGESRHFETFFLCQNKGMIQAGRAIPCAGIKVKSQLATVWLTQSRLTGNTETFLGFRLREALRRDKQTGNWKQRVFASPCSSIL
jgi:hypothetical protein